MGLFGWIARKKNAAIEDAIGGFIAEEIEDAHEGKKGPTMQKAVDMFLEHKTQWGGFCAFLAGLCQTLNKGHPNPTLEIAGEVFAYTGVYLVAWGSGKTDEQKKEDRVDKAQKE